MSSLLVFTESHARGGGNTYLVDLVDAVHGLYDSVTVASNPRGIFPEDAARFTGQVALAVVPVVSEHRAYAELHERSPRRAAWTIRAIRSFETLAFERNVRMLRRLIRDVRPTAFLACNGGHPAASSVLSAAVAAHEEGLPCALSIVSMPEPRRTGREDRDRLVDERVWRSVTRVIVNADSIAAALTRTHGMPEGLASVVRNGIEDSPLRAAYQGDGEVVIGTVSRLDKSKGIDDLVDAFTRLAPSHPDVRLVMVGDGDARRAAEIALGDNGLSRRSELPGWLDGAGVAAALSGFDVFVLPSPWEGFPYALLEAMRAGLPIVATDVGGIPEAIQDGVNGLLVPARRPEALAAAIGRLIDDPALRERLGRAARDRFEKEFSMAAMRATAVRLFEGSGLA